MIPAARLALRVLRDPRFRALLISLGPVAAKTAGDLARQGRWRQLAIVHADSVVDGSFMRVPVGAQTHWIVWSGDEVVACYPPLDVDLEEAVRNVDTEKRQRPDDLRLRAARRRAADRGRDLNDALRGGRRRISRTPSEG